MTIQSSIERLLDLTSQATRLKLLTDRARKAVEAAALDQHKSTGVIPKYRTKGVGEIRLDGVDADPKPYVHDPDEYASFIAQHAPEHVTATIELPADGLEQALQALQFAGVTINSSKAVVRDAYQKLHLERVDVLENDEWAADPEHQPRFVAADPDLGVLVPGVRARIPSPKLVVVLDKMHKAELEEDVEREAAETERDAVETEDSLSVIVDASRTLGVADEDVPAMAETLRTISDAPDPVEPIDDGTHEDEPGVALCAECGGTFKSARGLATHRRAKHPELVSA